MFHLSPVINWILVVLTVLLAPGGICYLPLQSEAEEFDHGKVQDLLIARTLWFPLLEGITYSLHKHGLVFCPRSCLKTLLYLFLVEDICASFLSVFKRAMIYKVAKFGVVFQIFFFFFLIHITELDQFSGC